jgi:hypothetical protein
MTDRNDDFQTLATFGADLSRWPEECVVPARRALLADPQFRRAWEAERDFDAALAAHCDSIDAAIAASGAAERVQRRTLARSAGDRARLAFGGLRWGQVAAAMLLSGMLGGVMDLVLPEQGAEAGDAAPPDILFSLDEPNAG